MSTIFADRYEVRGVLGAGGFSTVYEVLDQRTGNLAALKILADSADPSMQRRFEREVAILRSLRSPNSVRLLDSGVHEEQCFAVFELIEGADLSDLLEERSRLQPHEIRSVLSQMLTALDEAHRAGIVHRDIKPQNIRVRVDSGQIHATLLDFGIARATDTSHPSLTKTGELFGTPRYMSPEQLREQPLTAASDIYSLGLVGIELLVGSSALTANALTAQLDRLLGDRTFGLSDADQDLDLVDALRRMTEVDPTKRIPTAAAAIAALETPRISNVPQGPPAVEHHTPPSRAPLATALAIALAVIFVVGIGILVGYDRTDRDTPSDKPVWQPARPLVQPSPTPATADLAEAEDLGVEQADAGVDHAELLAVGTLGCIDPQPWSARGSAPYVPSEEGSKRLHSLILVALDKRQNALEFASKSGFIALADAHDVIVHALSPEADDNWRINDDDRAQIERAVDQLGTSFCIDRRRIYAVTNIDGSRLLPILTELPWITAIAANSHRQTMDALVDIRSTKPLMILRPTRSSGLPVDGKNSCGGDESDGNLTSIAYEEAQWGKRNGCREPVPGWDHANGECRSWLCDVPFTSCRYAGGQQWPGTAPPFNKKLMCSEPGVDFPAAERVWEFFYGVPLPTQPPTLPQ